MGLVADFRATCPPLYTCSVCEKAVEVIPQGLGVEPIKNFSCAHTTAVIWANRKVVLHGKGGIKIAGKIKLKLRQILSYLFGRSI